jgi:hypothetical protein
VGERQKRRARGGARRFRIIRQRRARAAAAAAAVPGIDTHHHPNIMDTMRRNPRRQVTGDSVAARIVGRRSHPGEDLPSAEVVA